MAKRKDAVALFEVITATKKKQAAAASLASQPSVRPAKWSSWFGGRSKPVPPSTDPLDPTYAAPALPPAQVQQLPAPVIDPTASQAVVQRVIQPTYAPPSPAPERVTIPERAGEVDPFGLDVPDHPVPARRSWFGLVGKKVAIDPDRREVTLRVRYTTAIVVGFAICVALGLAYVTGRQTNHANAGPNRITSEQVKKGAINPHVLDIKTGRDGEKPSGDVDDVPSKQPDRRSAAPVTKPGTGTILGAAVEKGLPRQNGLNYVIVQSYRDEKAAQDAQKALAAVGVPCTIERGVKGWADDPAWHCVVGVYGFSRVKNSPEYQEYMRLIDEANKRFSKISKAKGFEPRALQWRL